MKDIFSKPVHKLVFLQNPNTYKLTLRQYSFMLHLEYNKAKKWNN